MLSLSVRRYALAPMALGAFATTAPACILTDTPGQHGAFVGNVSGQFVARPYADRPLFELAAPFAYEAPNGTLFEAVEGYVVDGASVPRLAWSLVGGPFSGHHLNASVIHDYYTDLCQFYPHEEEGRPCQNTLERFFDDEVVHRNYYLGMLEAGVPEDTACAEYLAVSVYKSWDLDANGHPVDVEILGRPIDDADAGYIERGWAILQSSVRAVIRTRRTTGGQILNLYPETELPATEEGIDAYLERLRNELDQEMYQQDLARLGLLTDVDVTPVDELAMWPDGFLQTRFNPFTEQYEDLAFFEATTFRDQSPVARALNLEPTQTIVRNFPVRDDLAPSDLGTDAPNIILEILSTEGAGIPQFIGADDIQVQPMEGGAGVEYQLSPLLNDYLQIDETLPDLGSNGTIMLQQVPGGPQELVFQPAPNMVDR